MVWDAQFGGRANNLAFRFTKLNLKQSLQMAQIEEIALGKVAKRSVNEMRMEDGLEPYPEGWRASGRYLAQTNAMLADPVTGLPRHPLVLHRGGWPDGS